MPYRPNFPIPPEINPPRQCLCLEIPGSPEWKAIVAGLLSELTYWFNYERKGDMSGAQCAAVWKEIYNSIDWSVMSCCCGDFNVIFQWTVTGVLQVSSDGGETWVDDPEQDPRNSSPVYPPVAGDSSEEKTCIAATGMVVLIKEQVGDNLTEDMSRFTLQELIETWVTSVLQTSNPFQALINIAVAQIFALVIALIIPALTTGVYNTLTCIFVNNMGDDLSFTQEQWESVRADILAGISGIAGVFLEHLVFLLGVVGLTNLARSQAAIEGDCVGCDCATSPGDGTAWSISEHGVILDAGDGFIEVQATDGGDGTYYIIIENMACQNPTSMDATSGSITTAPSGYFGWDLCGEVTTHGVPNHTTTGTMADNLCIQCLQIRSHTAFTVFITLCNCP